MEWSFGAELWLWDARADSWTFVSLPTDVADEVLDVAGPAATRGFGSVRVEVTIGATTWRTSLFPDSRSGTYVLPVKKAVRTAVRTAEGLAAGDAARVRIRLLDVPAPAGNVRGAHPPSP